MRRATAFVGLRRVKRDCAPYLPLIVARGVAGGVCGFVNATYFLRGVELDLYTSNAKTELHNHGHKKNGANS